MELEELQRAIEAILFASGERIDIKRFADVFEVDPDEVEKAADALSNIYAYDFSLKQAEVIIICPLL